MVVAVDRRDPGGAVGLLGNAAVALINGSATRAQASEKARSDIVLAALKSDDPEKVKQNLLLLAKTKLLRDADTRNAIIAYVEALPEGVGPGLDTQATESAGGSYSVSSLATRLAQARRNAKFTTDVAAGKSPVLLWGDSWLGYPLLLKDIGDFLSESYAVRSEARPMMRAEDMVKHAVAIEPGAFQAAVLSASSEDLVRMFRMGSWPTSRADDLMRAAREMGVSVAENLDRAVATLRRQDSDLA